MKNNKKIYYPCRLGIGKIYSMNFKTIGQNDRYTSVRDYFKKPQNKNTCF